MTLSCLTSLCLFFIYHPRNLLRRSLKRSPSRRRYLSWRLTGRREGLRRDLTTLESGKPQARGEVVSACASSDALSGETQVRGKALCRPPTFPSPPQKQENPKLAEKTCPPAPALTPYLEKPALFLCPPPSPKQEEIQSEKSFPHALDLEPYPDRSKADEKSKSREKLYAAPSPLPLPPPALKEGNYKREDKLYSLLPPPPPPYSQPYSEATKSEGKPKPG